jgi:predicted tellurium resistance membrane protein TerC
MELVGYDLLFSLVTLTFLEIILGIDNLIFIALAVHNLDKKHRKSARAFGLALALIIRILMLLTLSWVMNLTEPLFYILGTGFSFKNFLLISGGLFLIVKSSWEIGNDMLSGPETINQDSKSSGAKKGFIAAVLQITLIDFIFSFDSVITAIGMTNNIPIIVAAIVISMIVMLLASEKISHFLQTYPSLKIVALAFIFLVGFILLADGMHVHISKGYLYFALFFTLTVESLNIVARKKHK